MSLIAVSSNSLFASAKRKPLQALLLLLALSVNAGAQSSSATDGATPSGMAPGAPAGSYQLSGFDSVNYYNGNLNFALPLIQVGGRGEVGQSITLKLEQKWRTESLPPGTANGTRIYYPTPNYWGHEIGFSPGKMQGRVIVPSQCVMRGFGMYTLTRLTFTLADGTEYEFHDKLYDGALKWSTYDEGCDPLTYVSRGKTFVTGDGTSATFVSDYDIYDSYLGAEMDGFTLTPSGYLMLKNGTRYRILQGNIIWMRDRHGNQINYTYKPSGYVSTITDSLNRVVTFNYSVADSQYGTHDQIVFSGQGGATRMVRVCYRNLSEVLRADFPSVLSTKALFPSISGSQTLFNPRVVSSVVLPGDNLSPEKQFGFRYNPYGELARVMLPTGGAFEYDYEGGLRNGDATGFFDGNIYRRVVRQRIYDSSTASGYQSQLTISKPEDTAGANDGYVQVERSDAQGTLLTKEKHFYYGSARDSFAQAMTSFSGWKEGKEYRTELFQSDGTTILQRVENTWQQPLQGSTWPLTQAETDPTAKANDPQVTQVVKTIEPSQSNLVSKQTFSFDKFSNQTDAYEYDYGTGAPPAYATRHTHIDYLTTNPSNNLDYTDPNIHLRGLPRWQRIYSVGTSNGAETLVAQSETLFDEPAYPLFTYSSITGWTDPGTAAGGNPTTSRHWLDTTGAWIETHARYDFCGNVRNAWDAKGNLSQMDYTDSFADGVVRNTYAFPTSSTSPVPDPTNTYGSTISLVSTSTFDYATGVVKSSTDPNGKTTSLEYDDPLDRLTKVIRPDGGWTSYEYRKNQFGDYVRTRVLQNSSGTVAEAISYADGLGRIYRTFQFDNYDPGNPWLTTDTQFDALGRPYKTSQPYRSSGSGSAINPSNKWTETSYDAANRVTSIITRPDNAQTSTIYTGNQVTITDQSGKSRRSTSDALGRLTQVVEGPNGAAYLTTYAYDVLGNLRRINQSGQTRFFLYDSLSRLLRAKNPEQGIINTSDPSFPVLTDPITQNSQWSIAYIYDENSNLKSRLDARGVKTTYSYDNLNRSTTVRYSDGTKDVDRHYDGAVNGRGLFHFFNWDASNNSRFDTHLAVDEYDSMGHPRKYRQHFLNAGVASPAYTVERTYDLAGHVLTQTYPSGRTVSYAYDSSGRTSSFDGNLGDGVQRAYASNLVYDEASRLKQEQFGTSTPVYNKHTFNVRGQLSEIRVGTSANDSGWNRGAIINHYSEQSWAGSGTDNNGNLRRQDVYIPTDEQVSAFSLSTQFYSYDALNRLDLAREERNGQTLWAQDYTYDQYGNRSVNASTTWGGVPEMPFEVEATTNRLYAPGDGARSAQAKLMRYDAAGNLVQDNYTGQGARGYDAEGRMTTAQDVTWQTSRYTYDADGRRVKRFAGGQEVWQVHGMDGELLAEYAAGASPAAPQKEYGYRNGELLINASPASASGSTDGRVNVALASNGATTNTSSTLSGYPASNVTDGDRKGLNYSVWLDGSYGAFPDWIEIVFPTARSIDEIDVITRQDDVNNLSEPTLAQTFSLYGITAFDVQYWTGAAWVTIPGGSVTGNNKVWRQFTFSTVTTSKIRVLVNGCADSIFSRIVEIEAYTPAPAPPRTNVALSANGAIASASSTTPAADGYGNYEPLSAINGERRALGTTDMYSNNTFWRDGTADQFPDWLQVDFSATKTIDEIDVYSLQDNFTNPVEPTETTTFSTAGLVDFDVQYWTGTTWASVPGGSVTGNNKVWRKFTFSAVSTSKIRVLVNYALFNRSRIVELEAYSGTAGGGTGGSSGGEGGIQWIVADQLGTPRMVIDQTGALSAVKHHDYLPFGEEIGAGVSGRTTGQGYSQVDNVRQHFTEKDRDNETGLDYFGARYYSSTQGRFTSVDPENASANPDDPQSWNGYAYARNNPLLYSDPDGRTFIIRRPDGSTELITDAQFNDIKNNPHNGELGIVVKNGNIYNTNGNGDLVSVGTYERVAFDDLTDNANRFIFRLSRFGPAMEKTILAFTAANLAPAVMIVGSGGLAGVGTQTLGLGGASTGAAAEGSLASLSIQQLNSIIHGTQKQLLSRLFGNGVQGAQRALSSGEVPAGLTREALLVYRELAQRVIARGIDKAGVQALRLKVIDEALKRLK